MGTNGRGGGGITNRQGRLSRLSLTQRDCRLSSVTQDKREIHETAERDREEAGRRNMKVTVYVCGGGVSLLWGWGWGGGGGGRM